MERNHTLNFMKAIASIGVVFIHILFPDKVGLIVKELASWAVPLFFMIAGYFSYGCSKEKILKRTVKISKIFVFGFICFFAVYFLNAFMDGYTKEWILENFSPKNLGLLLIFCNIKFAPALWYLIAMIETYLFWFLIVKKEKQDNMLKIMCVLFAFGALVTVTVESLKLPWAYTINFAGRALPWFMFGYLTKHKIEPKLKEKNNWIFAICILIGSIVSISTQFINSVIDFKFLGVLITAPAIFLLGIKNPNTINNKYIDYIGDNISLFIYIFHIPINIVLKFVLGRMTGIAENIVFSYLYPVIVLIITMMFSVLFYIFLDKTKLKKILV